MSHLPKTKIRTPGIRSLLLCIVLGTPIQSLPQACVPGSSSLLSKVPAIQQQAQFWCWAASSQMVLASLSLATQQCDMASQRFSLACCPAPANCNQPTQFDQCNAESTLFTQGLTSMSNQGRGALTFEKIKSIISCDQSPIIVRRAAIGSASDSHFIVIVGFVDLNPAGIASADAQKQQLRVIDPDCTSSISTEETLTYDFYQSNPLYIFGQEQYDFSKQSP